MQTRINIFLSSPNEVFEERNAVVAAAVELNNERSFPCFEISVVYYEDLQSGAPLDANKPPQATIDENRLSPNECHIVVAIFDRELGSPPGNEFLKLDGTPFLSGTEYELDQAFTSFQDRGFPATIIYRRERNDEELQPETLNYLSNLNLPSGTMRGVQFFESTTKFKERIKSDLRGKIEEISKGLLLEPSISVPEAEVTSVGRGPLFAELNLGRKRNNFSLFIIYGERGIGKSVVAHEWAQSQVAISGAPTLEFSFNDSSDANGDSFLAFLVEKLRLPRKNSDSVFTLAKRAFDEIESTKTILVLDGIEGLVNESTRRIDDGLSFFVEWFLEATEAICIVTSAVPISVAGNCFTKKLERLDGESGVRLLRSRGVFGTHEKLLNAVEDWRGHPLSLLHLAAELREYDGQIDMRESFEAGIDFSAKVDATERFRALLSLRMKSFSPELMHVMLLLAAFDAPTSLTELAALNVDWGLSKHRVELTAEFLAKLPTIAANESLTENSSPFQAGNDLKFSHPLVHEFFWNYGKSKSFETWKSVHNQIAEKKASLVSAPPKSVPECKIVESAVKHFAYGGEMRRAFASYLKFLKVDFETSHNVRVLGRFDAEIYLLRHFFQSPWIELKKEISSKYLGHLAYEAGFSLRANGRLQEAIIAFQRARDHFSEQKEFARAAEIAGDVALTYVLAGKLTLARLEAGLAVKLADATNIEQGHVDFDSVLRERIRQRSNAVLVETVRGDFEAGTLLIEEAKTIASVGVMRGTHWSFWFSEFSVASGIALPDVFSSSETDGSMTNTPSLDMGLKCLIKAKTIFRQISGHPSLPIPMPAISSRIEEEEKCAALLDLAEEGLALANTDHHKPRVWLAMARLAIWQGRFGDALGHLERVKKVSTVYGMRIYEFERSFLSLCLDYRLNRVGEFDSQLLMLRDSFRNADYNCRDAELVQLESLAKS